MEQTPVPDLTLADPDNFGLGDLRLMSPPDTFPITPASRISLEAIGTHQGLLSGIGLDWGCGGGCLSIAAARIPSVSRVLGLDIDEANIKTALQNAELNDSAKKTGFFHSDSYVPYAAQDLETLISLKGQVSFVLANPPSSEDDDGFEFRRVILRGARDYLKSGGVVFLSISYQYGHSRIVGLEHDVPGFYHEGILATTDCVPFDLERSDLMDCLESYVREEENGCIEYSFCNPLNRSESLNARASIAFFEQTQESPLSRWQTHLFRFLPDKE